MIYINWIYYNMDPAVVTILFLNIYYLLMLSHKL